MNLFSTEMKSERSNLGFKDKSKSLSVTPQVGKSIKKIDSKRKALAPGKRISTAGNVYYESRANRSDKPGKLL